MKRISELLKIFITILVLTGTHASGETLKILQFNPDSIVTIKGTITEIRESHWYSSSDVNLVCTLKQGNAFIHNIDIGDRSLYKESPKIGDTIELTGSKTISGNTHYVLGINAVLNNNKTINIRTETGIPSWSHSPASTLKKRRKKSFLYKMRKSMKRRR